MNCTRAVRSQSVIALLEIGVSFCLFPFDITLVAAEGQQCLLER